MLQASQRGYSKRSASGERPRLNTFLTSPTANRRGRRKTGPPLPPRRGGWKGGRLICEFPWSKTWVPVRGDPAAVHNEGRSGHVRGVARCQERHGSANLFRLTNPSQGCSRLPIGQLIGHIFDAAESGRVDG